jgi:hypothetical protein
MKKLINLIIVILLSGIITNCTNINITPEGLEEIEITKSVQISEKPIKEYWLSDYMPLFQVYMGLKLTKRLKENDLRVRLLELTQSLIHQVQ